MADDWDCKCLMRGGGITVQFAGLELGTTLVRFPWQQMAGCLISDHAWLWLLIFFAAEPFTSPLSALFSLGESCP
jgi:hypothetical protein